MSILQEPNAFGLYRSIFRNPAAFIFLILFLIIYTAIFLIVVSGNPPSILELIKAAPFAFSAIIVGMFSVLFWALNYIGRKQKLELRVSEAQQLFEVRRQAIDSVLEGIPESNKSELAILKAHLLLAANEINGEPETPSTSFAMDYSDAVKAILKKS